MLKTIHSYWAYLALLILVIAVVNALIGLSKKKSFTDRDLRIGLFTLIVSHIQLLIGLALYFSSPYFESLKSNGSEVMKDGTSRWLLALEHPVMMVLAIVLITVGWSKHKKKTDDTAKFKTFAIFYGIALVFILSKIPWSNWSAF